MKLQNKAQKIAIFMMLRLHNNHFVSRQPAQQLLCQSVEFHGNTTVCDMINNNYILYCWHSINLSLYHSYVLCNICNSSTRSPGPDQFCLTAGITLQRSQTNHHFCHTHLLVWYYQVAFTKCRQIVDGCCGCRQTLRKKGVSCHVSLKL